MSFMVDNRALSDSRIMLHSGRLFDLANPETCHVNVEEVAHGLAHTCRYAGQCDGFFSVAEHSVLVSQVATRDKLAALFHDAAEAFVGDMSRPLKYLLPEYKIIEKRIEKAIFDQLGISWPSPAEVKVADHSVMAAEQLVLMPAGTNEWLRDTNVTPAHVTIHRLVPHEAKLLFLRTYEELRSAF
jgi:uncharacterized protein